jgi:hypothetical protein
MGHRDDWADPMAFDIHSERVNAGNYIAWSNDPNWRA